MTANLWLVIEIRNSSLRQIPLFPVQWSCPLQRVLIWWHWRRCFSCCKFFQLKTLGCSSLWPLTYDLPLQNQNYSLQVVLFDGEEAFVTWSEDDSIYGSTHLAQLWSEPDQNENTHLSKIVSLWEIWEYIYFILFWIYGVYTSIVFKHKSTTYIFSNGRWISPFAISGLLYSLS